MDPQTLLQERTKALASMRAAVQGVSFVNEHRDEPRAGSNDFADAPTQDGGEPADPSGTNEPATLIEDCSELGLQVGDLADESMHDTDRTHDIDLVGGAPRQREESCGPNEGGDSFESENDAPTQDQPILFSAEPARAAPDGEPTRLIAHRHRC